VTSTKGKTLTEEQRAACHSLVHVPIMGGPAANAVFSPSGGGLTLEADVALSVVLHHFTAWSQREAHRWVDGGVGENGVSCVRLSSRERIRYVQPFRSSNPFFKII